MHKKLKKNNLLVINGSGTTPRNGDAEEGKTIRGQYEGPDQDLADMLERDVLETSLGIRWDDVAGLTEAKRLLEEIVVLPLGIPEYEKSLKSFFNVSSATLASKWRGE
ncbi:hypothetical protein GIB67_011915, partial [Kingdonia uniflora]